MDFVTLATESQRMLRVLDEMLGGDDDDGGGSGGPQQQAGQQPMSPPIGGAAGAAEVGARPLLSKSAEAELYLLATNFLLYVAMVIITTIIAKVYFPESRELCAIKVY